MSGLENFTQLLSDERFLIEIRACLAEMSDQEGGPTPFSSSTFYPTQFRSAHFAKATQTFPYSACIKC